MNEKVNCNVIKDLLSLSFDDLLSKESKELIEEHLINCSECKEYKDILKNEKIEDDFKIISSKCNLNEKNEFNFIKKLKKLQRKYLIVPSIIASLLTIVITSGSLQFKAILLIPILTAILYLIFNKRRIIVLSTFSLEFLKQLIYFISNYINGDYGLIKISLSEFITTAILSGLYYGIIYAVLASVGIIIGYLIKKIFID